MSRRRGSEGIKVGNYSRSRAAQARHVRELKDKKRGEPAATENHPPEKNPYSRLMERLDRDNQKKSEGEVDHG
jgi:hypothetical protein